MRHSLENRVRRLTEGLKRAQDLARTAPLDIPEPDEIAEMEEEERERIEGLLEAIMREFLRTRFEACYPFHPATLSVFQRKWQSLKQFQQTRGTLAMFAQWVSWAFRQGYTQARREPLLTLGSAPLEVSEFRAVILGQLGEPRPNPAIDSDIASAHSRAQALDADSKGPLKDIHRRVGTNHPFRILGRARRQGSASSRASVRAR